GPAGGGPAGGGPAGGGPADGGVGGGGFPPGSPGGLVDDGTAADAVAAAAGMSSNLDAGARLQRLLAVLAYLARVGGAPIADLAARFAMSPRALVTDLELAACCGLPPYTPDQLLELVVDEERVDAFHLSALQRPPRLTPEEGFAVAAASRALLAVQGSDAGGPLAGALCKLERALGAARVEVEIDRPAELVPLQGAAAAGEVVELDYLDRSGEEHERRVEPFAVVVREGRWYLDAWCRTAGGWRRFQVQRCRNVRRTGLPVANRTPPASFGGVRAFVGGPSTRRALVELPEGERALLDRVAAGPAGPGRPGSAVVPVDVADETWFGRLLLGIPGASVVGPPALAGAAAAVARRTLARYRQSPVRRRPRPRARTAAPSPGR
ncbi:MAG TPA: WYL domain-containing protein, partial [Acidimicrobiales bacterium]|nr:WYL domain-containing protein [Acidimicrobiales bacterium]